MVIVPVVDAVGRRFEYHLPVRLSATVDDRHPTQQRQLRSLPFVNRPSSLLLHHLHLYSQPDGLPGPRRPGTPSLAHPPLPGPPLAQSPPTQHLLRHKRRCLQSPHLRRSTASVRQPMDRRPVGLGEVDRRTESLSTVEVSPDEDRLPRSRLRRHFRSPSQQSRHPVVADGDAADRCYGDGKRYVVIADVSDYVKARRRPLSNDKMATVEKSGNSTTMLHL